MGMGFAPTWLRHSSGSHDHFNHWPSLLLARRSGTHCPMKCKRRSTRATDSRKPWKLSFSLATLAPKAKLLMSI